MVLKAISPGIYPVDEKVRQTTPDHCSESDLSRTRSSSHIYNLIAVPEDQKAAAHFCTRYQRIELHLPRAGIELQYSENLLSRFLSFVVRRATSSS